MTLFSVLATLVLPLLAGASGAAAPPTITSGPTLSPNPNPKVPLAATVSLTTDVPTQVTLAINDGVRFWTVTPEPGFASAHATPLLGVRPGLTHQIRVKVTDASGQFTVAPGPLTFTTPALPAVFPPIHVDASLPAQMEPGVTLFDASYNDPSDASSGGMLVMLDAEGEVVWYYLGDGLMQDSRRLSNGNILFNSGHELITEIDMFGDVVTQWWAANLGTAGAPPGAILVPTDTFHHEVHELPPGYAGDFLTLSTELRQYPNYPASESDPTQTVPVANVVGDVVVEFARDGTLVKEWKLLDVLDPYRISYGSLSSTWNHTYAADTEDWSHGNAVILDASDDSMILSLRHQEAVLKIDRASGALVWILGPPDGWVAPWRSKVLLPERPAGSHAKAAGPFGALRDDRFEWIYHQHAPRFGPAGRLMIFDNGNGRAVAPAPELPLQERYSRAVEFEIDPVRLTVRQTWDHGGADDKWYSAFLCDADPLPVTDNVLICNGWEKMPSTGKLWARIFEVTRDQPAVVVFQVRVEDLASTNPLSWSSYRSERLPDVYP